MTLLEAEDRRACLYGVDRNPMAVELAKLALARNRRGGSSR